MENFFELKKIIIYIIFINCLAFLSMGIDKHRAKKGKWRIKETTLFLLVLLGGGIGGICGMYTFRHKTQNSMFKYGFPAILILEIIFVLVNII